MQQTNLFTNPFSLQGKTILITGASSGIGRACAIAADNMGASLILFGRNKPRLEETLSLTTQKERHKLFSIDLTDYDAVKELFIQFGEEGLKFHGLLNVAGISTTLPLSRSNPKKIRLFMETNVSSGINLSQLLVQKRFLDKTGASIVFLTSVMAMVGEVGKTMYSLTKGALLATSKSMALELAPKKVRVNCVSPGVVQTPMSQNAVYSRDAAALARTEAMHPLGLGNTEDVANACVFLLSDAARWVSGTNLVVDGGYTAR